MVSHGLVDFIEAGSARLYTLNREHVAADAAIILSDLRERLFQRMRNHLEAWPVAPLAAAVFGSAARGDGGPDSDIDVLIVRPTKIMADDSQWEASVDELSRAILIWSGNHASIIQATTEQIEEMIQRAEPLVEALERDAVPLTEVDVLGELER
jgi:predicted nucleotidyltransferase